MELLHIHKDTWAAVGATALIPFYRLTDTDIILLDTGIAASDREGLTALLEEHGLRPKGILCSHAHYDHVGNAAYLRRRYGCPIAMPMIEAAICADATAFRANYETLTYGTIQSMFPEECFLSDVLISPDIDHLDFCGVRFGLLPLGSLCRADGLYHPRRHCLSGRLPVGAGAAAALQAAHHHAHCP